MRARNPVADEYAAVSLTRAGYLVHAPGALWLAELSSNCLDNLAIFVGATCVGTISYRTTGRRSRAVWLDTPHSGCDVVPHYTNHDTIEQAVATACVVLDKPIPERYRFEPLFGEVPCGAD